MDGAAVDALLDAVRSPRLALILLEARPDARRKLTPELLRRLQPGAAASRADAVAYVALCGLVLRRWVPPADAAAADWWRGTLAHLSSLWHNVAMPHLIGRCGAATNLFGPFAAPAAGAPFGRPADAQQALEFLVAFWEGREDRVWTMGEGRRLSALRRRLASMQRPSKRRRRNTIEPPGT